MLELTLPTRLRPIRGRFRDRPFELLDVGSGSHSASTVKRWFPQCRYSGIDIDRNYNNAAADLAAMDAFFEMDLTALSFGAVPDGRYDVVLMSHVIEHLHNGDAVIRGLLPKLRPGGMIYIEFPGPRSLSLPSMRESLNFHDDPTHVRVFTAREVSALLRSEGLTVLRAGVRRDPSSLLLMIPRAVRSLLLRGFVPGGVFWDLLGFAEFVVAVNDRSPRPDQPAV